MNQVSDPRKRERLSSRFIADSGRFTRRAEVAHLVDATPPAERTDAADVGRLAAAAPERPPAAAEKTGRGL